MKKVIGICAFLLTLTANDCNDSKYYKNINQVENNIYQTTLNELTNETDITARLDERINLKLQYIDNKIVEHYKIIPSIEKRCEFVKNLYETVKLENLKDWQKNSGLIAIDGYNNFCKNLGLYKNFNSSHVPKTGTQK
ncbi:MAG: hypothetical protein ACOC3X_00660 [Nanoarchaeota archaeon]